MQLVLLERAAPAKGTTWQHLSGRVAAYKIPLFPCQPGSQDGAAGSPPRRNLCLSQEVDYRKDVGVPRAYQGFFSGGREQTRWLGSRTCQRYRAHLIQAAALPSPRWNSFLPLPHLPSLGRLARWLPSLPGRHSPVGRVTCYFLQEGTNCVSSA